jgi:hypothetical protein
MKNISSEAWMQYKNTFSPARTKWDPALPADLTYQGRVAGQFDYVLPDEVLNKLRSWLSSRGEGSVYYFLTESTGEEATDFEIETAELSFENLNSINRSYENALTAKDFSWAIFVDHEGGLHVAGPAELLSILATQDS